jgi:hypothetical protein
MCGNVSAILDCCYSARTVRDPLWRLHESPEWLRELAEQTEGRAVDHLLSVTGHPRIVRLAASSSLRTTYPDIHPEGHLGRLTRLFTEAVRATGLQPERLTWDALAHHVREQAIWRLGCEEQWVSLIGPRQRLLFSRREIELPRTVGFVPRDDGPGGWIRAGTLQGVRVGDEWGLAELMLDHEQRPRICGRYRVVAADLNRAELQPMCGDSSAPLGASAHLLRVQNQAAVFVEGPPSARAAVLDSAWLTPSATDRDVVGKLLLSEDAVVASTPHDAHAPARFTADASGIATAIDRIEDWARAELLLSVSRSRKVTEGSPISAAFGRFRESNGRQQAQVLATEPEPPTLHVGDRVFLRVANVGERAEWFVSVVEIDVAGRPVLLDESEPDGRELLDGETVIIGEHSHRRVQGIELAWPEGLEKDRPRGVTIILFASRRPIQLGHLVRGVSATLAIPYDIPRVRRVRNRGRLSRPRPRTGPELARDWSAVMIRYQLDPRPR